MATATVASRGWLRTPGFDLVLIGGVLALALALGAIGTASPSAFLAVLLVDLWVFAYPHVASTWTRVDLTRHRFLILALPPLVLAATAATAWMWGAVALNTIYFYWQSAHYTRQSDGIARAYRRAAGAPAAGRDRWTDAVVYAFPIWGVLHRIDQRPTAFYGAPFLCPPLPAGAATLAGAVALGSLVVWAVGRASALRAGEPVLGGTLHVLSHVVITSVAYFALEDITQGWLFVNIWHNAQYLLFVWAANARRFHGGQGAAESPRLAWLSQPSNALWYAVACLGVGAAFYLALGRTTAVLPQDVLPVVLVVHLAVNFHHYLVDAVIWRTPRTAERSVPPQNAR